jgi:hypothetical protein
MHVAFFQVLDKSVELDLARLVGSHRGVKVTILRDFAERCDCDLYCLVGVKHFRVMRNLQAEGARFLFWDKGYNRCWSEWWRVSYCSYQPWREVLSMDCPPGRAIQQGWTTFKPWKQSDDGCILYAGASQKYHTFCDLPEPHEYLRDLLIRIRRTTRRPVMYRPRLNPAGVALVEGCVPSAMLGLADELAGAAVMLTHGSSACLEALFEGVPCVVLGEGVTRGLSSTDLAEIKRPRRANHAERLRLVSALAYFQWCRDEIAEGLLWPSINSIMQNHTCAVIPNALNGGAEI